MFLLIVRAFFVVVWGGVAAYLAWRFQTNWLVTTVLFTGIMLAGILAVGIDLLIRRKNIGLISAVFFGLLAGVVLSNFVMIATTPFLQFIETSVADQIPIEIRAAKPVQNSAHLIVYSITCYLCISFLLQTKDDFRFIIPYVEFARELKGLSPLLLDTSVIIDGRVADLAEDRLFDNPFVVPAFVLSELQMIADNPDKVKRNRGRRGLDVLNRLRSMKHVELRVDDTDLPEFRTVRGVDQRLVLLAKHLSAKIITNDFNLDKLASAQDVPVINLNHVATAMRPPVLPGEYIEVRLTKLGDQPGQGVGYLEDGTMVVAEQGKNFIGEDVRLLVTSVLQTNAGRMIFGRIDGMPRSRGQTPAEA